MLELGAKLLDRPEDLETGLRFTDTCYWAYDSTTTGLAPEQMLFYGEDDIDRYLVMTDTAGEKYKTPRGEPAGVRHMHAMTRGRPETIESVFYSYRLTGDRTWQDKGWKMFTEWISRCTTEAGFASLHNVAALWNVHKDSQESYVLAETLKYYFLLFSEPDYISLDDYVFNTEAHPLRLSPMVGKSDFWSGPDPEAEAPYHQPTADGKLPPIGMGTSVQRAYLVAHHLTHTVEWRIIKQLEMEEAAEAAAKARENAIAQGIPPVKLAGEQRPAGINGKPIGGRPMGVADAGSGRGLGGPR